MVENDVKNTCGGTRLDFNFEKDENFFNIKPYTL